MSGRSRFERAAEEVRIALRMLERADRDPHSGRLSRALADSIAACDQSRRHGTHVGEAEDDARYLMQCGLRAIADCAASLRRVLHALDVAEMERRRQATAGRSPVLRGCDRPAVDGGSSPLGGST